MLLAPTDSTLAVWLVRPCCTHKQRHGVVGTELASDRGVAGASTSAPSCWSWNSARCSLRSAISRSASCTAPWSDGKEPEHIRTLAMDGGWQEQVRTGCSWQWDEGSIAHGRHSPLRLGAREWPRRGTQQEARRQVSSACWRRSAVLKRVGGVGGPLQTRQRP